MSSNMDVCVPGGFVSAPPMAQPDFSLLKVGLAKQVA